MKSIQLVAFGEPTAATKLVETASPQPSTGQLRVAVEAAPINPSDFLLISGKYGYRPALPSALGAEGVGRVVAVGNGVDASRVGERVLLGFSPVRGTWSEELVIDEKDAVTVDGDGDPTQLAMLGINPATAYALLHDFVDLKPGDWVAQTGANSATGRYVIQLAKQAGLRTLNVVRRPEAAAAIADLGGDAVVVADENLTANLRKALGGERSAALLLDPIGGPVTTKLASIVRDNGTVVSFGGMSGEGTVLGPGELIFRGVSLRGFWLNRWRDYTSPERIAEIYRELAGLSGKGVLATPVEASYGIDDFQAAFAHAAKSERGGKILFRF
jgi:NADPH:quinone reductase-like Zn-dependent oxidoreductase